MYSAETGSGLDLGPMSSLGILPPGFAYATEIAILLGRQANHVRKAPQICAQDPHVALTLPSFRVGHCRNPWLLSLPITERDVLPKKRPSYSCHRVDIGHGSDSQRSSTLGRQVWNQASSPVPLSGLGLNISSLAIVAA